jgi:hypothetical protein
MYVNRSALERAWPKKAAGAAARLGRDRATRRDVALGVLLQAKVARGLGTASAASIASTLEALR